MKILPILRPTFDGLRNNNAIYVDKTDHVFSLTKDGGSYFLSRPRRFGKSLLISTFEELFKGNKKLFEGLYIYDKWDWSKTNPVIHLDFTEITYSTSNELKFSLNKFVELTAEENEVEIDKELPLSMKFAQLIEKLHEKRGEEVVILVDEYDKPLIDNLSNKEVYPQVKRALHDFYQVIKAKVKHERFVFLTGVSQFSGLSIFSGLNNLIDITMYAKYGTICGYTQEELENNFEEYIESTAQEMRIPKGELLSEIKYWYNGYSWDGKTFVYNPFSTLLFFDNKRFSDYWYGTGTPTFLIEQIKKKNDLESFTQSREVGMGSLKGDGSDKIETTALLFQTGYLTIKKEEIGEDRIPRYRLDLPNIEVKNAFLSSLMKEYALRDLEEINGINRKIARGLKERREEDLQKGLVELFANIAYDLITQKESYYHSLFLVAGVLSGYEVEPEVHTDKGRIDAVLKKGKEVVVVEIKYGKGSKVEELLKEAMEQIKDRKYYEKYASSEVSLLAIAFGDNKEIACKFGQK
jgi:Holliday junction resolvase-like predicted endonuclease